MTYDVLWQNSLPFSQTQARVGGTGQGNLTKTNTKQMAFGFTALF